MDKIIKDKMLQELEGNKELLKKSNNEIVEFLANKGIITDVQTIGVYKNNMRIENNSIHKVKMNKQPKNRNFW